jgi:hypothetical protein
MKGKLALIVGLGAGYVLGTRDGRGRYQQIKSQATRLMQDPRVQQKASRATDLAKDKAPAVKDVVKGRVAGVTHKATSRMGKHSSTGSDGSPATTGGPAAAGTTSTPGSQDRPTGAGVPAGSSDSTDSTPDDDAIVVTAPSPSPLAPGPTQTTSSQGSGDLHG